MSPDDHPHIPKINEAKPVVWTAEDASRFLTSAIHEAQKPLAEALKQRPITSKALTLIVAVLIVAAIAIALILSHQLEKTEKRADDIQAAREEIFSQKVTLEAQTTSLQERLSAVSDQHLELKGQIDALRQNEEKHKRTQTDLGRFRRQNELLRSQIVGLEMEKVALSRQLEAVKALAEADPEEGGGDPFDSSGAAVLDGSSPAPEEAAGEAVPAAAVEEPMESVAAPAPAERVAAPEPAAVDAPAESAPAPGIVPAEEPKESVAPPAPAEPAVVPEPAAPEDVTEPAAAPVAEATAVEAPVVETPASAESAIVSGPVAEETVTPAPAESAAAPDVAAAEESGEGADAPAPAEAAFDAESLRQRAAEAMENARQSEISQPAASGSVEQFKIDPEKQAHAAAEAETGMAPSFTPEPTAVQEDADDVSADAPDAPAAAVVANAAKAEDAVEAVVDPAAVTMEMDKALQEGRAVPGAIAAKAAAVLANQAVPGDEPEATEAAEGADDGASFRGAGEEVEARSEAAAPAAEDVTAPAAGSEYVTLDPNAAVPSVQESDATSEE